MKKLLLFLGLVASPVHAAEPFALKDGDRVVLLGNTLIEREQRYGWWEFALTRRFPDRNITFRNLGWSGDTVWGEARAGFGTQADGFKHLKEHVLALKPTVLIIGYGGNEAFDGPAGLAKFEKGLNDLLDALAPARARVVLLSPTPMENLGPPLQDPSTQNKNIALYRDVIRGVATRRDCFFIDFFEPLIKFYEDKSKPKEWVRTENGIHLREIAYYDTATGLDVCMNGINPTWNWTIGIAADGEVLTPRGGVKVDNIEARGRKFRVTPAVIASRIPQPTDKSSAEGTLLAFRGLAPGKYTLYIDGKATITNSVPEWAKGQLNVDVPSYEQAEKLRQAIIEKNRLYFHRWRPQNETYLFGFRKKEQGQNAIEIPQFDPLIAALEAEIAKLRVPTPHIYELKPE